GGDAVAVERDGGAAERREARAIMDARLQQQVALGTRVDADAGEDTDVPGLVVARDYDDLHLAGVEHRRRPHPPGDAGVHGTAHDPFAVAERADAPRDLERRALEPD